MFKSFFKNKNLDQKNNELNSDDKIHSITCILIEAALVDENFGKDEREIIIKILKKQFELEDTVNINAIVDKAIKSYDDSSDLITHTRKIKENWSIEKRIEVIEMLWKVCLVDGVLEPYEDMLIRRVSGLIYVDDKNRNIAKNNALRNLNEK
jgi:uncharacterized tellurite resistance protein B-like protein